MTTPSVPPNQATCTQEELVCAGWQRAADWEAANTNTPRVQESQQSEFSRRVKDILNQLPTTLFLSPSSSAVSCNAEATASPSHSSVCPVFSSAVPRKRSDDPKIAQVVREVAAIHPAVDKATLIVFVDQSKLFSPIIVFEECIDFMSVFMSRTIIDALILLNSMLRVLREIGVLQWPEDIDDEEDMQPEDWASGM